jgi:hypothetical protein
MKSNLEGYDANGSPVMEEIPEEITGLAVRVFGTGTEGVVKKKAWDLKVVDTLQVLIIRSTFNPNLEGTVIPYPRELLEVITDGQE